MQSHHYSQWGNELMSIAHTGSLNAFAVWAPHPPRTASDLYPRRVTTSEASVRVSRANRPPSSTRAGMASTETFWRLESSVAARSPSLRLSCT